MHLEIAELIRSSDRLVDPTKQYLEKEFSAFYLGSVAPDVQSVADIRREDTHFYFLPPKPDEQAHATMLKNYPQISNARTMPIDQAVFIAAYCAHLMLDLRWYHEVLVPFFVERENWVSHRQAFLVHNTLLTYLDKSAVDVLPESASETLFAAEPGNWLPFAADSDLVKWRDLLVKQLKPGAMLQTIEVYARRMGMSPEEFAANLDRPEWMNRHLFSKVPVATIEVIMSSAIDDSIDLISDYLEII